MTTDAAATPARTLALRRAPVLSGMARAAATPARTDESLTVSSQPAVGEADDATAP